MPLTIDENSTEWVTLEELKAHTSVSSSASDSKLQIMLEAAQDAVEGIIGPVLWRTVVQTVDATQRTTLALNTLPVLSVTSMTSSGNALSYTLVDGGLLKDVSAAGDVVITYVAGRAVVPSAIRLATMIIAAHLWETQLGTAPSQMQEDTFDGPVGIGYAIPSRAMDLLAPYQMLPGVA